MVEKLTNFKQIKEAAGRVKPVVKVQSIFPAIAADPQAFYDTFAPICDLVATNPLIDYLRNDDSTQIHYHEDFSCPQLYQRLTIAADGQVLLCANDENNEYILGDANTQTIHDIWHGAAMTHARARHACHRGAQEIEPCRHCYLPRRTEPQDVAVGERTLTIENYLNRSQEIGA
jgi:radical SAM protein with 4Fe4S-binding SPASM domain